MGRSYGYILIKGDKLSSIDKILESFHFYNITTEHGANFDEAMNRYYGKSDGCFGICIDKGWTIIYDLAMQLLQVPENYDLWRSWSSILDTEIFAMEVTQGVSSYQFYIFDKGKTRRAYWSLCYEVKINEGDPIPIEQHIAETNREDVDRILSFDIIVDTDIFKIMKYITGIDDVEIEKATNVIVKMCRINYLV